MFAEACPRSSDVASVGSPTRRAYPYAGAVTGPPFEQLEFLYMPSRDVEGDLAFCTEVLRGEVVFAIDAFDTRVAEVRLTPAGPRLLLADHLEAGAAVLVYRVSDFEATVAQLERQGLQLEARFGIPHGPCAVFHAPGGQRLAIYELTRPEADARFAGRHDFGPGSDRGA